MPAFIDGNNKQVTIAIVFHLLRGMRVSIFLLQFIQCESMSIVRGFVGGTAPTILAVVGNLECRLITALRDRCSLGEWGENVIPTAGKGTFFLTIANLNPNTNTDMPSCPTLSLFFAGRL